MPWPGTNIPAPWDPKPPSAPPDTTQRNALIKTLTDQHGGQVGSPSTPMVKNPQDPSGPEIPGPYDLYTFADGTSVEIAPTGEVSSYTLKTPTGTSGWTDITQVRNPDQSITFYGKDPKDPGGPLKPVEGLPTSAAPASTTAKPTPSGQLDKLDASGNVIPPGDTTTRPVTLRDSATGTVIDIPKDPAGAIQKIGNTYYVIKPDGSTKPAVDDQGNPLKETDKPTTTNVPGIGVVTVDPTKPIGQRVSVELAEDKSAKASQLQPRVINGKTYVAVDAPGGGGIVWQEAKDENGQPLPTDQVWTAVSNDPRSSVIQLISSTGETKSIPKADWKPPPNPQAGQAITPDTTSPFVVTIGDNGQPVFTDNKNQVSITEATRQFIDSLGVHLASGSMSEAQAQDLIKNITSQMTAQAAVQNAKANQLNAQTNVLQGQTTAAGNIVQGANQGAQTGAGLLQNRVTAAGGMVQNLVGQAANAPHLMSAPAGLGENLVQGAQGWATELGGGQGVYDAAANMVKAADPSNQSGLAAQGYAALTQMLQKYQDLTGAQHPAATVAAQAGLSNGFNAPSTLQAVPSTLGPPNAQGFNPQASTAALNAAGFQDTPQGRAAAVRAGRGDLLGLPPTPPPAPAVPPPMPPGNPYMSYPNQVPGQNYGASTAFIAPTTVIPTAPTVTA